MQKWWNSAVGSGLKRVLLLHTSPTPSPPFSSFQALSYHTIQAIPRDHIGNRVSARDRAQGRIPTVVFSQSQEDPTKPISRKQLLTTERKQIKSILKSVVELPFFCSTVFQLQIRAGAGSSQLLDTGTVLPIKIQRDKDGNILNLVLVWANEGSQVNVDVPIVYKGEDTSPGIKKGGYILRLRESLRYQCPVESIPPKLELDVSKLDVGDKLYVHDIKIDPSLKLLSRGEKKPLLKVLATKPKVSEPKTVKKEEPEPVAA